MTQANGTCDPEFYFEQGYFHLRPNSSGFLKDVEAAAQTFDDLLKDLSGGGLKTAFKNKEGKIRHLSFVHLHNEIFRRLMLSEEVRSLARSLFGSQRLYVTHSKISCKEAGQELAWYPHQDNGYKLVNGVPLRRGMTVGIFLEDADDCNGTIQVFPGSQTLKTLPHIFKKENDDDWSGQIVIEDLPKNIDPKSIIARKGDIVALSLDTIHQSQPNHSHGFRPLLLFEIEPYDGFPSDEHGNPPVVINGELSPRERLMSRLHGIPRRIWVAAGSVPLLKRAYRRLRFG